MTEIVSDVRDYMELTPEERRDNGILRLDERGPEGWREVFTPEIIENLDVSDASNCPLYHIYGGWWEGCEQLDVACADEFDRDSSWYGFACEEDTEAWKTYLRSCAGV